MNRDQQLLALVHRRANPLEALQALLSLTLSAQARQTYRRYGATTKTLRACLADDDVIIVKKPVAQAKPAAWLLLAFLAMVIVLEFSNYTVPAIHEWFLTVAHKCGL